MPPQTPQIPVGCPKYCYRTRVPTYYAIYILLSRPKLGCLKSNLQVANSIPSPLPKVYNINICRYVLTLLYNMYYTTVLIYYVL